MTQAEPNIPQPGSMTLDEEETSWPVDVCVSLSQLEDARRRITPFITVTPTATSRSLNELTGMRITFKCENMQRTGSFKFRGACNSVLSLDKRAREAGVTTHSSGNHGQALALAARCVGVRAKVVVPSTAPSVKRAAMLAYGAEVVEVKPTLEARVAGCAAIVAAEGATLLHPSNDARMIAGHASLAFELLEQVGFLPMCDPSRAPDVVIVPVGGGGLIAGVAAAFKAICPRTRVVGAEPAMVDDAFRSKREGRIMGHPEGTAPCSVADGLNTVLGDKTWPIVRSLVDEIVTVSEEEIAAATLLVWQRLKHVVEPSAGTGVAVCLADRYRSLLNKGIRGREPRIAIILCGGNVDVVKFINTWGDVEKQD